MAQCVQRREAFRVPCIWICAILQQEPHRMRRASSSSLVKCRVLIVSIAKTCVDAMLKQQLGCLVAYVAFLHNTLQRMAERPYTNARLVQELLRPMLQQRGDGL